MSRIVAVLLTSCLLAGCASNRALERRAEVRAWEAPLPPLDQYRSAEGFGPARWGMSVEEVRALVPGFTRASDEVYDSSQAVAGRQAQVAYVFYQGHLGRAIVRVPGEDSGATYDALRSALDKDLGAPGQSRDVRRERDDAVKAAVAVGAVVVVGAVLLAVLSHSSHGGGGATHGGTHAAAAVASHAAVVPASHSTAHLELRPVLELRPPVDTALWVADVARWDGPAMEPAPPAEQPELSSRWARNDSDVTLLGRLSTPGEVDLWYESRTLARFAAR